MVKMAAKKKPKKGAPTLFKEKYTQALIDFFDVEPYRTQDVSTIDKNGDKVTITKEVMNDPPFMVDFHKKIGVGRTTVYDWIDPKHDSYQKEFSNTYKKVVKECKRKFYSINGLKGLSQQAMSIFLLKAEVGMKETQVIEHDTSTDLKKNIDDLKDLFDGQKK